MGKFKFFNIVLNKPIFSSGETISGNLQFKTKSRFKINSISILAEGQARVKWNELTFDQSYVCYKENEQYLNLKIILANKQDQNNLCLEKGEYTYPFQIALPENLPSSFEHQFGNIRYSIKGTIEIPWNKNKHTFKQFTILNGVELNKLSPSLRQPMEVYDSKNVFFSIGGDIHATLRVEKCGFVPGEKIHFTAKINNTCNRKVVRTRAKLVQELKFVGSNKFIGKYTKTRHEYQNLSYIVIDKQIEGYSSQEICSNELLIPSVRPSLIGINKIIQINYLLVFTFGIKGSIDKDLIIPIMIGTVSFLNNNQENILSYDSPPNYDKLFGNEQSYEK